jgi:hypothetical protein
MINKYKELHEQLLDLLVEYHNAHVRFLDRQNSYNCSHLIPITKKIGRLVKEMRKHNFELRQSLLAEKRSRISKQKEKKKNVKHT